MELNKAIEVVRNIDTTNVHCKNCVLEEKDKCITDLFGYSCQRIAIDTVLEELNNRIPRKDIEEEINKLQEHKMDILGSPIHNANEKIRMIKKNTTRIETLEHLLKKFNKE